ncbi:hypothetical protein CBM2623_B30120 [Cupriavidus taiwanensis]|nr:hypothetical protein CBM2608_B30122 [Cupriavidus taiwanensis]SPA34473.1 hypothetical protein CBM2623_B30120 [Cupriavidus taiwanensis]
MCLLLDHHRTGTNAAALTNVSYAQPREVTSSDSSGCSQSAVRVWHYARARRRPLGG